MSQQPTDLTSTSGAPPVALEPWFTAGSPELRQALAIEIDGFRVAQAQERVLGDVYGFTENLASACEHRTNVESDRATRMPGRLERADDAVVLHAALVASMRDDAATTLEAVRLLAQRFLNRNADRVTLAAARFAGIEQ